MGGERERETRREGKGECGEEGERGRGRAMRGGKEGREGGTIGGGASQLSFITLCVMFCFIY